MKKLVLLLVVFAISGIAGAGIISVNLAEGDSSAPRANQTVLPEEVAGMTGYEVANWNNIQLDLTGASLVDSDGAATGAVINFQVTNGWGDNTADGSVAGANDKIARGYFDDTETHDGIGVDIEVTGISYDYYNVLLYLGTDTSYDNWKPMTVGGQTQTGAPLDQFATKGGWIEGENVLVYTGLTGAILDVELTARWADDNGSARACLSGLQIVEVPEPASLILLGMGGMALLRRKRA